MSRPSSTGPEFSRLQPLESLSDEVLERSIAATADERAALAARLGLLEVDRLEAVVRLRRPTGGDLVRVDGRFEAEVTQACVVTLAPLRSRVARDFAVVYSLAPGQDSLATAVEVDIEQEDPPEALGPEGLDLGEAVVQQLAVSLDSYPRSEGGDLAQLGWQAGEEDAEPESSPFEALKALKGRG
jgi:uncharacterized metal-binding protein YceD (DUF177 family)